MIHTTMAAPVPETGEAKPSAPSASPPKNNPNGFAQHGLRTVVDQTDEATSGNGSTVRAKPLKTNGVTDADGADANLPSNSASGNGSKSLWTGRL